MEQGRQGRSTDTTSDKLCPHPMKPALGCVAHQTDTTGTLTIEAKCMLAESIESITSRWLMSTRSSAMLRTRPIMLSVNGYILDQRTSTSNSFGPEPKRNMRCPGVAKAFTICSILSNG